MTMEKGEYLRGEGGVVKGKLYILYELLYFGPKRIFTLRGNGEVHFLLGGVLDVVMKIGEVGGRLEVYFPVVRVHCSLAGERSKV